MDGLDRVERYIGKIELVAIDMDRSERIEHYQSAQDPNSPLLIGSLIPVSSFPKVREYFTKRIESERLVEMASERLMAFIPSDKVAGGARTS